MKKYASAIVLLIVLCGLAATGRAKIMGNNEDAHRSGEDKKAASVQTVSPEKFQPIKAEVLDKTPSHYTIDVKKLANMSADDDAPVFAVYVTSDVPAKCGDFRKLELSYKKPEEYKRQFDLSEHPDVLKAIDNYGCVVMKNIPAKG
ncbi:MAG: hypothetical protein DI551_02425 [Micavibrio aeruginosavorus]|uniref:Uncharacterized protein n=1 Tax=Micavibrio aeruginosavorus TaxID=349221 RepID=A0A2W5N6B0_9BACT|nr:MAG: hypothetical protein DI551_02425 [Micavibrio aeruginosavorus]